MSYKQGYTPIENYFIDHVMPRVSAAEWKIITAVFRETVGWQREEAEINLDRFMVLSGFARQAASAAVKRICGRGVVQRRSKRDGRQRNFVYKTISRANLKALPLPGPEVQQESFEFNMNVTEIGTKFENQTSFNVNELGQEETKFENQTLIAGSPVENQISKFENQTLIGLVLSEIKKEDLDLSTHTKTQANITKFENQTLLPSDPQTSSSTSAASPRVCASKFSKLQIREYAWASHNFVDRWNSNHPSRKMAGIRNPEGWATAAFRSGDHDDEIQEWLDDPGMFNVAVGY